MISANYHNIVRLLSIAKLHEIDHNVIDGFGTKLANHENSPSQQFIAHLSIFCFIKTMLMAKTITTHRKQVWPWGIVSRCSCWQQFEIIKLNHQPQLAIVVIVTDGCILPVTNASEKIFHFPIDRLSFQIMPTLFLVLHENIRIQYHEQSILKVTCSIIQFTVLTPPATTILVLSFNLRT